MLSVHKRQGKFRLQKDCNGFGFSLLLCRNVHSLEVPLIAPCWQLLLFQLCLRLQTQLSQSVYPSLSPRFHQMHTTFLTDAASKPLHLSPVSTHYFSSVTVWPFSGSVPLLWDPGSHCVTERTGRRNKDSPLLVVNLCFQ